MLAKKTSKNPITLARAIVRQIPATDYFDVSLHEGTVLLKPVVVSVPEEQLDVVPKKLRALGVAENDVKRDAVGQGAGTLMRVVLDPNTPLTNLREVKG